MVGISDGSHKGRAENRCSGAGALDCFARRKARGVILRGRYGPEGRAALYVKCHLFYTQSMLASRLGFSRPVIRCRRPTQVGTCVAPSPVEFKGQCPRSSDKRKKDGLKYPCTFLSGLLIIPGSRSTTPSRY